MFAEILAGLLKDGTLWGIAVALIGGYVLKRWPDFPNRFIPIATAVVAVVTQFINFFNGQPVVVPVVPAPVDTVSVMGFFDGGLFKAVVAAVLQWVLTDKVYETQRKAVVAVKASSDAEAKKLLK